MPASMLLEVGAQPLRTVHEKTKKARSIALDSCSSALPLCLAQRFIRFVALPRTAVHPLRPEQIYSQLDSQPCFGAAVASAGAAAGTAANTAAGTAAPVPTWRPRR